MVTRGRNQPEPSREPGRFDDGGRIFIEVVAEKIAAKPSETGRRNNSARKRTEKIARAQQFNSNLETESN